MPHDCMCMFRTKLFGALVLSALASCHGTAAG